MESTLHGRIALELNGMELLLMPDYAVWSPVTNTVFVADLHFGKEATFRVKGIPIPDVISQDLKRLDRLIQETRCQQLIILGDLLHSRSGRSSQLFERIACWRRNHQHVRITLIRGNHDRHAGKPPENWGIICEEEPFKFQGIQLFHHPPFDDSIPSLAGHLHPKFRLEGQGERLDLPGFLLRDQTLVLPAFSTFIDHGLIPPRRDDRFYVIADQEVFPMQ